MRTTILGITASFAAPSFAADKNRKQPNIVVIFLGDSDFADFRPFGNTAYPTPNISKLTAEGCHFTNFHIPRANCFASHDALLNGRYPERSKPVGAIRPSASEMDPQCPTIVQILKSQGYTSAIFSKWHTEHAVDFIKRHQENPFFLYIAHNMPHAPLSVSREFKGKTGEGLYADVMMELDWSMGRIMAALRESGVEDNTLVFFTSDNGPWISYSDHAFKAPYREVEGISFDGGSRCACIMKMPGRIATGTTSDQFFCSIDLMPTFAALAGAKPPDIPFDGLNMLDIITA